MRIGPKTTLLELGCIVCSRLNRAGIRAFLSGGAVVTIYSDNEYQSYDLDFVSHGDFKRITQVMAELGFNRERGRHFVHPRSKFFVEFPGTAASVGEEPIHEFEELRTRAGVLRLLTPTYCVMDRLSAFYHWNDRQCLEQAILVARAKPIALDRVRDWSKREGMAAKFLTFERGLAEAVERADGVHPWRLCPAGQHWVVTHPLHVPPSRRNPAGKVTSRHHHCARNPSGKDQLFPAEIDEIAARNFSSLKNVPCPSQLDFGKKGSTFDSLIAGWVQYWNDVLHPEPPLDPNLVKALIASESSFDPKTLANRRNANSARGLMQITDGARKELGNEKGELRDHFVTVTRNDLYNPGVNICAGVRWLFQKRLLATATLGRPATWDEAIAEYKSVLGKSGKRGKRAEEIMKKFRDYLEKYRRCGK